MTSTLGTALQDLGSGSDPARLPSPEALRSAGDRRRRRKTAGAVAATALTCSAVVLVASRLGESDPVPRPVDPVPSPTRPAEPEPSTGSGTYPINTDGRRFSVQAVAARDGRFVVVGDSSDLAETGPAVYWSDDGAVWHPPAEGGDPDSVNVTDVIATSRGFLAVGVGGGGAWHSTDGQTWSVSPVGAVAGGDTADTLWGVTSTRLGFFAWGFIEGRAALWRSADGSSWTPVADESVFDLPDKETICAVQEGREGLVATGVEAPKNTREGRRVAWTSVDGRTWELSEPAGEPTLWCDSTQDLGHWEARTDAGLVRIDPYGPGDSVHLTQEEPE
jgi:hypothetical protein